MVQKIIKKKLVNLLINANILILILISFSLTLDSIKLGNNPYLRLGSQKVDTTNITLDFNEGKGIDLNFITVDPKKGRISESFIGEPAALPYSNQSGYPSLSESS